MTEKLYWNDCYQTQFDAKVLEINNQGIFLDKTLFYPEGGNQVSDRGVIKKKNYQFEVKYVSKKDNLILHHLSGKFKERINKGDIIEGIIDWEYRYGVMRAHSSQHLLSAIFKNSLNIDTTRANISFEDVSLHISKSVNMGELEKVLQEFMKASTIENLVLTSKIISQKEAENLDEEIRGDLSSEDNLRIIEIQNCDVNCCGGTHVKNTSEIGPCYFYEIKKGSEFKYLVGNKAIEMLSKHSLGILDVATSLNRPIENIFPIVKDQIIRLKEENLNFINKILELISINPTITKRIKLGVLDFDIDYKILSKKFKEFPPDYVLVIKRDSKSILILSNSEEYKANEAIDLLIKKYGGKGGGSPKSAQVVLTTEPKDLIFDIEINL